MKTTNKLTLASSDSSASSPAESVNTFDQFGPFDGGSVLQLLFSKARPDLSAAELTWLADGASDYAEALARRASCVANGLGCLIAADEQRAGAGNFQARGDVPALLFHFGEMYAHVAALVSVASQAQAQAVVAANGGAA
ncbi:MAG: hypothetical protein ABI671_16035 [Burkholderiales bacterium]